MAKPRKLQAPGSQRWPRGDQIGERLAAGETLIFPQSEFWVGRTANQARGSLRAVLLYHGVRASIRVTEAGDALLVSAPQVTP